MIICIIAPIHINTSTTTVLYNNVNNKHINLLTYTYIHTYIHRSEVEHLIRDGLVQHVLTDDHF